MTAFGVILLAGSAVWAGVLSFGDIRERRLPNFLTLGATAVALVWRFGYGGWPFFLSGFVAAALAGVFMLFPFLMRGAGGGDVKMMMAAGAIAGIERLVSMLWFISLAGVIMGVIMIFLGKLDAARLKHYFRCCCDFRYDRRAGAATLPPRESERVRMPFSIPIGIGLLIALVLQPVT